MAVRKQHSLPLGSRIRQYEILEYIGGGGMGEVYRAQHLLGKYERAIKVINTRLAQEENFVQRFIREARIMARIDHKNIVRMHEFDTLDENILYMVLELLRGETVYNRVLNEKRIALPEAVRIIRESAEGLEVAHAAGIIHRDISPDNLMIVKDVSGNEITKVIDFGVAKPVDPTAVGLSTSWRSAAFIGKPEYSSPEQCGELKPGDLIDARSDIYSLGMTFYNMITGKLPFAFHSRERFFAKHCFPATLLSDHFPPGKIPKELDAFMLKALSPEREERFQSMKELSEELNRIFDPRSAETGKRHFSMSMIKLGKMFAGRYELQQCLDEVPSGPVYQAFDHEEGLPVALKFLQPALAEEPAALRRLRKEVRISRQVMHPNVCRIYYFGKSEDIYYLTMQYVEGQTLAALIREKKRLSIEEGLSISLQILQGLGALHDANLAHLDLRPRKIMIDKDSKAYIMDFGLSAQTTHGIGAREITATLYVAPEQWGSPSEMKADSRSDIYSFGITLFEMLTGQVPFGGSPMEVINAHKHTPPRRPSEWIPDFPIDLEKIILKTLEKNPDDRYQTVQQLLDALKMLVVIRKVEFSTVDKAIAFPVELRLSSSALSNQLSGWSNGAGIVENVSISKYKLDLAQRPEGGTCLFMHSADAEAKEFGCWMQRIPAKDLTGKVVRFESEIATQNVEGWAGLWLQADSLDETLFSYNTGEIPIQGTTVWKKYSIQSFLPQATEWLNFGIVMTGKGLLWADGLNLTVLDEEVKEQPYRERKIVLMVKEKNKEDRVHAFTMDGKNEFLIGRSLECEVLISGTGVSRKHSKVFLSEGKRWMIQDLGSRNGTVINGKKVQSSVLSAGDEIQIGHSSVIVSEIIS